jgi:hypothetical protein
MALYQLDSPIKHILAMGSSDIAVLNEFPPERLFAFIGGIIAVGLDN